jgi:stalled ribosome alternative rescue factor ArfA
MARQASTTEYRRPEALTLSVATPHARRVMRRHSNAMLRDDLERARVEHRVGSTSSYKKSAKGNRNATSEVAREVCQWGGIDAKRLQLASLDERAKLCVKAFGRALKAREWRNLQKALDTENREVIAKLTKGFRNSR